MTRRKPVMMYVALTPGGQVVGPIDVAKYLHARGQCAGTHCPIHKPSDHPLDKADMVLRLDKAALIERLCEHHRLDKAALIERLCEHGVGHDDPDSVAWLKSRGIDVGGHGCDGCCR